MNGNLSMDQSPTCLICKNSVSETPRDESHNVILYSNCACGSYIMDQRDADNAKNLDPETRARLSALLRERALKGFPQAALWFTDGTPPAIDYAPVVRVSDLLATWPATVPERLDRILCNLARRLPKAGQSAQIPFDDTKDRSTCFSVDNGECEYYRDTLVKLGWLEHDPTANSRSTVRISHAGWAHVAQLEGGLERRRNPAFVAMWFGGEAREEQDRMECRFKSVIREACRACGWDAARADSSEHNDSIMDRIIHMISVAPFVIADLTQNNDGVYYEAGFARGRNIDVIYLVEEGTTPHFDVSGVNHVRWAGVEELRNKLENRILGTLGRGPHRFPDSAQETP